ncbi:2-oxoglutarate dehydrogenase E1 component [Paenibacillus sophorae]|uniref:2-oxoglutarate dehydrogenase E1 component n=1 Tax=Paenibacillus sophorae TaxID=1333845 RepID=A0A1H8PIS0_9BACL|nr:2-oxoglutarate dehydrogenase E1 component [Paenibacillus sophorae]QWU16585.1 2-oxoglutarate dehydrogenase E1 component [Paenibacillus sophorae]SEO41568.1 2-oxoglutarate dehydrogenase E1 component [Paenibacillus sophorae]
MSAKESYNESVWSKYYGPNLGYIQEKYEHFAEDPSSVEAHYRELFTIYGPPPLTSEAARTPGPSLSEDTDWLRKAVRASKLIASIRIFGHLAADIDPLEQGHTSMAKWLDPETYELTREDLLALPASLIWENAPQDVLTGWDAYHRMRQTYTKTIAYEFGHVHDEQELRWLNSQAESATSPAPLTPAERKGLLGRLIQVEQFETFLHKTFVGQKRFSLEGNDALVPMLDEIVRAAAHDGAEHILMGMAHRGRLNVLAHILGKPYDIIFSEFHHSPNKELFPSEGSMGINYGWTGDVKYHLGADRAFHEGETVRARLTLANNPSHLEFVNPVVEGFARAAQEDRSAPGLPVLNTNKAMAVLIHGDAAFPGEGIVAETLNIGKLQGYQNGGTIHIIVNNRIGFTTESEDSRSTHYASDLAKGYEIPIVHVNADDPEACIDAVRLASAYRNLFKKDFLIDLIGYRRHGHNEMDDPEMTQPIVYGKVKNHPTVLRIYAERLEREKVITQDELAKMSAEADNVLQQAYERMKEGKQKNGETKTAVALQTDEESSAPTAVPLGRLQSINRQLLSFPEGFKVYPKLQRILQRRKDLLNDGEKVDWALAETLAFATILQDGTPIRLSGQDAQRGTFSQRHLVLHDSETGELYSPLHQLEDTKASFGVYNSPLSEASVLGYEYGYNVFAPETFVLWEAQYGDFANAAQVIIDQFISAGRAKWTQRSNLAILLPHGYEGQGPEHSSGRLERYLQLSAEENWTVANLTSAAQYFHLLRRQASLCGQADAKPLVIMAPKSLLRNPRSASSGLELASGQFQPVLPEPLLGQTPGAVKRLVVCSGKIAIDLQAELEAAAGQDLSWLHILRFEQLYPFPARELAVYLNDFTSLQEIIWVQEEPKNMGAWSYIEPRLRAIAPSNTAVRYIGRPERSSPASGYADVHTFEQRRIVTEALNSNSQTKAAVPSPSGTVSR